MEQIGFQVPNAQQRLIALGEFQKNSKLDKQFQYLIKCQIFKPIDKPQQGDWLSSNKENGQPYNNYIKNANIFGQNGRDTIYIQPLENDISQQFLSKLKLFCEKFYLGVKVKVQPVIDIKSLKDIASRGDYQIQYNCFDILKQLENHVPNDAYCVQAVTQSDLYPYDNWGYVFGWAMFKKRTGVFSLARFDDNFYSIIPKQQTNIELQLHNKEFYQRSIFIMLHEIGHMFGLWHCIYHQCLMNGINSYEEQKTKPEYLCPVCLKKLQYNLNFDIIERYKNLKEQCQKENFKELSSNFEQLEVAAQYKSVLPVSSIQQAPNTVKKNVMKNTRTQLSASKNTAVKKSTKGVKKN